MTLEEVKIAFDEQRGPIMLKHKGIELKRQDIEYRRISALTKRRTKKGAVIYQVELEDLKANSVTITTPESIYLKDGAELVKVTEKKKDVRHRHGEFKNVLLTNEEVMKLKEKFPKDWDKRIEALSGYIASRGDKYDSHYRTILVWAKREENPKPKVQESKFNNYTDTNAVDYTNFGEKILKEMLGE